MGVSESCHTLQPFPDVLRKISGNAWSFSSNDLLGSTSGREDQSVLKDRNVDRIDMKHTVAPVFQLTAGRNAALLEGRMLLPQDPFASEEAAQSKSAETR